MKRSDLINSLVKILETMPEGASNYHIVDILIGKAERLGMLPPDTVNPDLEGEYNDKWTFIDSGVLIYPNHVDYGKDYYVNKWDNEDND